MFTLRYELNSTLVVDGIIHSPRSPGFDRSQLYVRFSVDSALGNVFVTGLKFSLSLSLHEMLRVDVHFNATVIRRTSGRSLETFKPNHALSDVGVALDRKALLYCC